MQIWISYTYFSKFNQCGKLDTVSLYKALKCLSCVTLEFFDNLSTCPWSRAGFFKSFNVLSDVLAFFKDLADLDKKYSSDLYI